MALVPMKETFRALTGLRLFAALAVVCFHYGSKTRGFGKLPAFLQNCVHAGPIALGFFYVLSGFVLAHAYSGRPPYTFALRRSFWFARIARLYPVYLLAFVLFVPMAYEKYLHRGVPGDHGSRTFVLAGILGALAIQAWTPLSQAWNGPSWSLSVEAFFYFVFPFVLVPICRAPKRKLIAGLTISWGLMIAIVVTHHLGRIPANVWQGWVQYHPLFWLPMFLIGIATYRYSRAWRTVRGLYVSWLGGGALTALTLLCGLVPARYVEFLEYGGLAPLIVVILLVFSHPRALIARAAGVPILYEAGAASYALYVLQSPVWNTFQIVTSKLGHVAVRSDINGWQFSLFLLLLVGVAVLVHTFVERFAQKWLLEWRSSTELKVRPSSTDVPSIDSIAS
jgi:peptidoglycan/LPS O-acetylase OafA/YrhL